MSESRSSASSEKRLISQNNNDGSAINPLFMRDPSDISTKDFKFPKLLENGGGVEEQTLMQVEFINDDLLRKARRSELANKNTCLTRRWQTALTISLIVLGLAGGIGGLAYWITLPKVITGPYLLYNETCYMNSRSCDETRMLWCPDGICVCTGDFVWNVTAQNCTCGPYETWTGFKCQGYGYYGDPCNTIPCRPTLTCSTVINQTYTTGQHICICDNATYLYTNGGANQGNCVARLSYNAICKTEFDCQNWFGLTCSGNSSGSSCLCDSTSYWNGSLCVQNALGWEFCSATVPCDTTRGLTCSNTTNACECDQDSFWDNITTLWCQHKETYSVSCQYDFQCNTTVNLSCPSISTGCNCPVTSYSDMCDCQIGNFWDGQRCVAQHSYNGTCPGQYACTSNLVCYLGHCICPGKMTWNNPSPNMCACPTGTVWNITQSVCV